MANIIITGANQGIGYYFTEQALKDGNKVAVLDIETDHLRDLAQVFPKQLLCYKTDVCDDTQIHTAVKEIAAAFHSIDIAIHNACLCTFDDEHNTDLDIYEQVFNVNYYGGLRLAKSVLPYMREQKRGENNLYKLRRWYNWIYRNIALRLYQRCFGVVGEMLEYRVCRRRYFLSYCSPALNPHKIGCTSARSERIYGRSTKGRIWNCEAYFFQTLHYMP